MSSCGLRKTLSSLSADGWGCVPALFIVSPEASKHWSLQAVGWGQVLVRKWWPPGELMPMSTPQNYCCQCLCPCSEPQLPPPHSAVDTSIPGSSSGPCLYEVTGFFPVSWCTRDPVCPLQVWSFCFPQSYEIPVIKLHWPSKQIPGGILLLLSDPQAREPDMGLRTITPVGEPLRYNYFPVCGLPTRWVWDLILS